MDMVSRGRIKLPAADDGRGGVLIGEIKRWENLSADLLVMIFSRIEVEDLIDGVPYVCSSWRHAARDSFCWRSLDFRRWDVISYRLGCHRDDEVDFADLFDFVITRSKGFIACLHFPDFANEIDLKHLANRCPELRYFTMKNPNVYLVKFCKAIGKLKYLKGMAVDESLICHQVLQHINHCCPNFIELKILSDAMDRQMASTICECLPHLQKLEITNCLMSGDAILALLEGLREIKFLDVSGYPLPGITSEIIEKASHLKIFRWDSTHDLGEFDYCSHSDEDFVNQTSCQCMLDQKVMEWLASHP